MHIFLKSEFYQSLTKNNRLKPYSRTRFKLNIFSSYYLYPIFYIYLIKTNKKTHSLTFPATKERALCESLSEFKIILRSSLIRIIILL